MADFYPSSTGSNIGTLLRLIQEDQSKNIVNVPPGAQPGSPIRDVVQQPLQSPEAPQSSRVVSVKPEGAIQQGPQQAAPGVIPPSIASAPVASAGGVIAPRAPIAPSAPAPSGGGGMSAPSSPSLNMSAPSTPNIGTRIMSTQAVLGASTNKPSVKVTPKSAPTVSRSTPKTSRVGQPIVSTLQDLINRSFKLFPSTGLGGRENIQKTLKRFA